MKSFGKLFFLWMLGKTIKLDIMNVIGDYVVTQVTVNNDFSPHSKITIELENKDSARFIYKVE